MARIEWLMREHGMNGTVARLGPVQRQVHRTAEKIGTRARRLRARHFHEGQAQIEVKHNLDGQYPGIDSEVALVDPAAGPIEFGHINHRTGKFTKGTHIMRDAYLESIR